VRTVSTETSPAIVAAVIQPSPCSTTLTGPLLKGDSNASGISHQLTPLLPHSRGISCLITPPIAPKPSALPVMRPGRYTNVVPVIENWICAPLVIESSSRIKFVSYGVRPGRVEDGRILDMRIGRPVSVARSRRVVICRWPSN